LRVLAFDTATPATTVALSGLQPPAGEQGERTLELRDDPPPGERPRHATRLLGLITEVMERAGAGWEAIDRIAVGVGPGTFTGLRIGIATAKALARAAEIPLVGVSTLHALALGAEAEGHPAVAAILDARRGEAFAAVWEAAQLESTQPPALSPRALAPDALLEALRPFAPGLVAIGDGALAFRGQLERAEFYVPDDASELHRVTAAAHCRLALLEPVAQPDELHPDYQRQPDAQPRTVLSPSARRPHDR
jgi:tRNA threonylcarbamoyladenosine biosynthesis protein TsaB